MKNYTILFLLMLLSSCQHRKQTLGKEDEKKSELQQFFQVINLKDNLKKCEDELLMSTFVDSVWYVKLETNEESLLGDLGDVKLTSNYLFIDSYHAKCPMMYDKGGKYIHSLGQIGQGPGEFLSTLGIAASDSIFARYFIDLGKYKLPATGYDIQNGERANYIVIRDFVETKDHLLFRYVYQIKCWFSMYDKQTGNIKTWNCAPLKAIRDVPFGTVPIVNDIDGASDLKGDFRYADSKHLYSVITADQSSEVIKIIEKERVVRFPNKKAELKKKLSEMGGDDNPIIVFYRLKD